MSVTQVERKHFMEQGYLVGVLEPPKIVWGGGVYIHMKFLSE